jgi:hypothetical protein
VEVTAISAHWWPFGTSTEDVENTWVQPGWAVTVVSGDQVT